MANTKISNLPAAASLFGSDLMPVVQGGVTKKGTFDQIPFLQAGTGAVARTAQAKMRDTVSVKDFGAVGDGVADDTAAFIAACATGSTVFIPANTTIRIATAITSTNLTVPFAVLGASRTTSRIYCDVDGVAIRTTNSNARSQWSNLTIYGNLSKTNSAGLDLFDNSSRTIDRLEVHSFSKTAIKLTQVVSPICRDLRIYSVGTGVEISPGSTASISPALQDVYITSASIAGIDITGACQGLLFINPVVESSAIGIRASSANGEIVKPYYEANTLDTNFTDSVITTRGWKSTADTYSLTWSGVPANQRFMWRDGAEQMAVGGLHNASTRINSVINTWESLLCDSLFSSPYISPNPGGVAAQRIQVNVAGIYKVRYSATWSTATASAGWGNNRILKNGTEVPGSFAQCYVPAIAGASVQNFREFIVSCAVGDTLDIQYGTNNLQVRVAGNLGGNGPAPTAATCVSFIAEHARALS